VVQAIHSALASAGAEDDPVVAAVGGPEVVIRQVALPPLAPNRILPALEIQHRDLGLLPPGEAVMDAQVLRKSKDGTSNEVLSVSAPKGLIEERRRLFQQAAVNIAVLDAEPLALLNGAIQLTGLDPGELIVLVNVGRDGSVLCLFSENGPVVARYLEVGAGAFNEALRGALGMAHVSAESFSKLPAGEMSRAETACREVIERMAEDLRLSLTFYRTEYDRDSLPRWTIGGQIDLPQIGRWLADRLGLTAPFEVMDPFKGMDLKPSAGGVPQREVSGPQFLQAFGLALRGL
jgi:type IV pilus assembly protein PilM